MPTDAIEAQVRQLRVAGLTPKLIARKLGLPQREVSRIVAAIATQRAAARDVVGCWVSPGWSDGLTVAADRQWPDGPHANPGLGLVTVLVAREHRHDQVSVCVYLVDVNCLGVKNALGPRSMSTRELPSFLSATFGAYTGDPVPAPLELAAQLVFGAVEFARGLGFQPHADFAPAAGHLGEQDGPAAITFGRDGTPIYVQGPYDDPRAILRTLEASVGRDGYHFIAQASALDDSFPPEGIRLIQPRAVSGARH